MNQDQQDPPLIRCAELRTDVLGCAWTGTWAEWLTHVVEHDLPHPDQRAPWELSRRSFVGASEIAAVCGLHPYDSALDVWAAKVLGLQRRKANLEGRATSRLGHLLEPALLEDYAKQTGAAPLMRPSSKRHPLVPWAAATPDGVAHDGTLVQVKLVGARMLHHWREGHGRDTGPITIPRYVKMQVQWEMFVWEARRAVVVAGLGGTDVEHIPLERDDELIDMMVTLAADFWTCVVNGKPPQIFDGGEPSNEALGLVWPSSLGVMKPAPPEVVSLATRYAELRDHASEIEAMKDAIGAQLKALTGDLDGYEWGRANKVTWKETKPTADKAALLEALLKEFVPNEIDRQKWLNAFTPAVGPRRLNVTVKQKKETP